MFARPQVSSMSDAQHYITNYNNNKPLSDYAYQIRLACLSKGAEDGLFRRRSVERAVRLKSRSRYTERQILDWPMELLFRSDVAQYRNLLDAKRGRLAIVCNNYGAVAFQMEDGTVCEKTLDWHVRGLCINANSMQTICIAQNGALVAIGADLSTYRAIMLPVESEMPTSVAADSNGPHLSAAAKSNGQAALVDSRLHAERSVSLSFDTSQIDGVVQFSPDSNFLSVRSPRDRLVQLFDVRVNRRQVKSVTDCLAAQWAPRCDSTLTTAHYSGAFFNHKTSLADSVAVFEQLDNDSVRRAGQVVDFHWDSSQKHMLAFFCDFDSQKCCLATRSAHDPQRWRFVDCNRDCADSAIDRYSNDKVVFGSCSEIVTVCNFVERAKSVNSQRAAKGVPNSALMNCLIR